jgi:hypothetical protein
MMRILRFSLRFWFVSLVLFYAGTFLPLRGAAVVLYVDGVSGGQPTAAGDIVVRDRLISLGHTVTTVLDSAGTITDTLGKDLIVISSSVQSADMSTYATNSLRTLPLPILDYEPALFDELLMGASGNNVDFQTSLIITLPSHPLAAGFSGTKVVYNTAGMMAFGVAFTLGTDATVVATSEAGDPAIFTYEKGSRLSDDTTIAAARRIGFYFNAVGVPGVNADGLSLFDAAVGRALIPEPTSLGLSIFGMAALASRRPRCKR